MRELRQTKDWTLADLAKQSGVALSSLSRIETGKMTGTLESHILIAKALGVRLPELYADLDPSSATIEYRSHSQSSDKFTFGKGANFSVLTTGSLRKKILPILVTIPPGRSSQREQAPAGVEKFLYLVKGEAEVTGGEQSIRMSTGDSLYLQASIPHLLKNSGSIPAILLSVTCPPTL